MRPQPPSSPAPIIGAIVGVLLLAGVGGYFLFGRKQPPPPPPPDPKPAPAPTPSHDPASTKTDDWRAAVLKANPFHAIGAKPFQLQEHEVTRDEYARYLAENSKAEKPLQGGADLEPGGKDANVPITWVTYDAAEAYCHAIDARIPTAAEWDAAVKGPSNWKYPWGNDWPTGPELRDIAIARGNDATPMDVKTNPYDKGAYGQFDLAGNVQEWTSTDSTDSGKRKLLRGGDISEDQSVYAEPGDLYYGKAAVDVAEGAKAGAQVGFRCAKDK